MVHNFSLSTRFWVRMRFTILVIVISLLLSLVACGEEKPDFPDKPSPEVIITAWTAEVTGELLNIDGCARILDRESNVDYAIVWTPDVSATIEGDEVRIISGIVRGNTSEIVLRFGDIIRVSGGETTHPDQQLLQTLPPNCQGPYWVVGFEISLVHTTKEP
jgi:hypothetical protein